MEGGRTERRPTTRRSGARIWNSAFCLFSFGFCLFFKVMTKIVQNCGSSERCCQFYFKMRVWHFFIVFNKLLKCLEITAQNPVKYTRRVCGKLPRRPLCEGAKLRRPRGANGTGPRAPRPRAGRAHAPAERGPGTGAQGRFFLFTFRLLEDFSFYMENALKLCS